MGKTIPSPFGGSLKIIVRNPQAPRATLTIEEGHGIDIGDNIDFDAVDVIIKDASGIDLSRSTNREKGWLAIRLEADFETNRLLREWIGREETARQHAVKAPVSFSTPFVPSTRAILRTDGPAGEKSIMVWTRPVCVLGRSPSAADIVCILMPGNPENNTINVGISRRHCRLAANGHHISVSDEGSTCGTFVDNRQIDAPHVLSNGEVISLGDRLSLQYRDFRCLSATREVNAALTGCHSVFDCSSALSTINLDNLKQNAPLESFRLRRVNNYRDRLEYLFLLTSATIGASSQCALRLDGERVADQHARLLMTNHEFHLVDLNAPSGTRVTRVNGKRLDPYLPFPLGRTADILIGDVKMAFSVFA
jgi:pSer/pThr/pTyr-binding forkhead associated (FHA) protein